jgi:hypothetical protein
MGNAPRNIDSFQARPSRIQLTGYARIFPVGPTVSQSPGNSRVPATSPLTCNGPRLRIRPVILKDSATSTASWSRVEGSFWLALPYSLGITPKKDVADRAKTAHHVTNVAAQRVVRWLCGRERKRLASAGAFGSAPVAWWLLASQPAIAWRLPYSYNPAIHRYALL